MRKLFIIALTAAAISANAQIVSTESKSTQATVTPEATATKVDDVKKTEIFVEYNYLNIKAKDADEGSGWNGFTVGFIGDQGTFLKKGFAWSSGFAFRGMFYSKNKVSASAYSMLVPCKFGYSFGIGPNFHITPYAFWELQFYLAAGAKYDGESINYFKKDDMGSSDATWSRFHAPFGIGVNFSIKRIDVGVRYGWDVLTNFGKDVHGSSISANIGFRI